MCKLFKLHPVVHTSNNARQAHNGVQNILKVIRVDRAVLVGINLFNLTPGIAK